MLKALDLFCGAGGASVGLHRAGFDVIGVDRKYRRNYPFRFLIADALDCGLDLGKFDLIWASPPCQKYSTANRSHTRLDLPDLIPVVRDMLARSGALTVIENVPLAPIRPDVIMTGDHFGLPIIRRRHFELNFPMLWHPPGPTRGRGSNWQGVYGHGGSTGTMAAWSKAMKIDWMGRRDIVLAVPPAYAEAIGRCAAAQLGHVAASMPESGSRPHLQLPGFAA